MKIWHTFKPIASDIGSNRHRYTDTNWNIHEGNRQCDRIIKLYTPYAWTLNKTLPKPFRNLFFFVLYKIVRYFSSHNGVPSINIMVSSKTYFVYVADFDSFLTTPKKKLKKRKIDGKSSWNFASKSICLENDFWLEIHRSQSTRTNNNCSDDLRHRKI